MSYNINYLPDFAKEVKRLAKKYKSLKQDLDRLESELLANPMSDIDLGNGMHKVRMAIASKNRGKSHGARVIDYVYEVDEENGEILMLDIYDKAEQESLPPHRIAELLAIAKANLSIDDEEDDET